MTGARCRPPCCQRLRLPLLAHRRDTHQKCRPGFFHRSKSVDYVFSICSKVPNIVLIKSGLARFCSFHHQIKCQLLIMSFTSKSIVYWLGWPHKVGMMMKMTEELYFLMSKFVNFTRENRVNRDILANN